MNRRNFLNLVFGGAATTAIAPAVTNVVCKGSNAYDAGLFYCPYVPLQMVRAVDPDTFQPKIGIGTVSPNTQLRISKND